MNKPLRPGSSDKGWSRFMGGFGSISNEDKKITYKKKRSNE